jgi:hypothetical protein
MPLSQPLPASPAGHPWSALPPREQRGSRARCILLTDGPADVVAHRLSELAAPAIIDPARHHWMPRGFAHPKEAKLGDALPFLSSEHREAVTGWWLSARRGANTPNWDIASTATIDGKEGLVLVEAKAHAAELKIAGKPIGLKTDGKAGEGTAENHQHIGAACREASAALNGILPGWNLSVAGHYQLCNRFAWAWRIAALGVPVVLVYLGFLRAAEMHDEGLPLADAESWQRLVRAHSAGILPATAWDQPISIGGTTFRAVIRSMEVPLDGVS